MWLVAGCGSLDAIRGTGTPAASPTQPPIEKTLTPEGAPSSGPLTLKIWLPPDFDPANETPQGDALQARLDEFSERHPGVRVEVRIKALEGSGGLLDSLGAAYAAAPLALPDLIALKRPDLQKAAGRGLITAIDEYLSGESAEDWYDFALGLSTYREQTYGLPFAGDALILAYRPTTVENPPKSWEDTIQAGRVFAFAAADPRAEFTLALYLSMGGSLVNENGQAALEAELLEDLFSFYLDAENAGVIPFWMTQYDTNGLAWQTFSENRAQMAVSWTNAYFAQTPEGINAAQIPTQSGTPVTVVNGWTWALSGSDPQRHALAVELAEFLSAGEFQAEWTTAAGYLPTRPSALAAWEEGPKRALASQILPLAQAIPDEIIYTEVSKLLNDATIAVLKKEISPAEAAAQVVGSLNN